MNLTETKDVMSGRARLVRGLCGCAAMLVVTGAAATLHLRPAFAATPATDVEQSRLQSATPAQAPDKTPSSPMASSPALPTQAKASGQAPATGDAGVSSPPSEDEDGPTAVAGEGGYVHRWVAADGKKYVTVNHNPKEPNEEERLREERKLEDAQKGLDEMKLDQSLMSSRRHELEKDLAGSSVSEQQMRDSQQQVAESKKALDEATKWIDGPEFRGQMAELEKNLNSAQMKAQIRAATKVANDPVMKLQMDELEKQLSQLDSLPELKKLDEQLAIVDSAMKEKDEQMAKLQKEMESGELKAKLEEATRLLEEVNKKMEQMQMK